MKKNKYNQKIGKLIKKNRVRYNLSQRQLGDKIGCYSKQSVSRWENGYQLPTVETFAKIAKVLDISREEWFNCL